MSMSMNRASAFPLTWLWTGSLALGVTAPGDPPSDLGGSYLWQQPTLPSAAAKNSLAKFWNRPGHSSNRQQPNWRPCKRVSRCWTLGSLLNRPFCSRPWLPRLKPFKSSSRK
jgi:hypothetical protein